MGTKARWDNGILTYYDASSLEVTERPSRVQLYDEFLGVDTTSIVGRTTGSGFVGLSPGTADTVTISTTAGIIGTAKILSGTADNDCASIQADASFKGSMSPSFECRLTVDSASAVAVFIGFADATAAAANITAMTVATTTVSAGASTTEAVGFIYDTDGTPDYYYPANVKNTAVAQGTILADLPVAGTYAIYRVDLRDNGSQTDAYFYIDGVYKAKLTDVVTRTTAMTPIIQVGTRTGAAAKYALVDYCKVWSNR